MSNAQEAARTPEGQEAQEAAPPVKRCLRETSLSRHGLKGGIHYKARVHQAQSDLAHPHPNPKGGSVLRYS